MHRFRLIVLVLLTVFAVPTAVGWHNGRGTHGEPAAAGAPEQRTPVATTLLRWIDQTRDAVRERFRVRIELDGRSITISFGSDDDRRPAQIAIPERPPPRPGRFQPVAE